MFVKSFNETTKKSINFNEFCILIDVYENSTKTVEEIAANGLYLLDSLIYNLNVLEQKKLLVIHRKTDLTQSEVVISAQGMAVISYTDQQWDLKKLNPIYHKIEEINNMFRQVYV